ncbi:MAG: cytochrome c553 [Afipia broomeae]|jgi:cytochrome c553|uniref:c-type cytochrome n=1 Tax=unclassified Afipia TaxID=2642050 RepID=UPI000464F094|nr:MULTISPECIES: cytochrome c [unclassified Afipia]MAH69062.1 cytochrome C554 [Afipia sp.]OUX61824.1 MAG: cytochrome C554 [Afipia sp. TMED4]RTL76338.1 MAG: cytochrome c [Bradyrhizobiaceae bacterium]HAP12010.1 cytochrome C554 [Afipia sp.]HAP48193.1 cytochrome C554 [Afipia sp.]
MRSKPNKHTAPYLAFLLVLLTLNGVASTAQAAGDAKAGRKKAQMCSACHGIDGIAKIPIAPNIAGSPAMYLEKQLKAFRSEERKEENMNVVAKPLSDADIADLAAWYSGIAVEVTLPN